MNAHDAGVLVGSLMQGTLGLVFVFSFVVGVFLWPLFLVSAVWNIRRIRIQLERLNNTLESRGSSPV